MSLLLLDKTIFENTCKTNDVNTLKCNSFTEVHFDVFEIVTDNGTFVKENISESNEYPVVCFDITHNNTLYKNIPFKLSLEQQTAINWDTLKRGKQIVPKPPKKEIELIAYPEEEKDPILESFNTTMKNDSNITDLFVEESKQLQSVIKETFNSELNNKINEFQKLLDSHKKQTINELIKHKNSTINESHGNIIGELEVLKNNTTADISTFAEIVKENISTTSINTIKEKLSKVYDKLSTVVNNNILAESKKISDNIASTLQEKSQKIVDKLDILSKDKIIYFDNKTSEVVKEIDNNTKTIIEQADLKLSQVNSEIETYKNNTTSQILENINTLQQSINKEIAEQKKSINQLVEEKLSEKTIINRLKKEAKEKLIDVTNSKEFKKIIDDLKQEVIKDSQVNIDNHVKTINKRLQILIENNSGGGGGGGGSFSHGGNIDGNINVNGTVYTNSLVAGSNPPSSSTDHGTPGTITWDANYVYICVDTDQWVRAPLAMW